MSTAPHTEEQPRTAGLGSVLNRVKIRNYKSIANCDVELGPFTILVGRNGSGKSNFLDALNFTKDALTNSIDEAINSRRGNVSRITSPVDLSFAIELEAELPSGLLANYGFEIGYSDRHRRVVTREFLDIHSIDSGLVAAYEVVEGQVTKSSIDSPPPATPNRLYLAQASARPEFRPIYDALLAMNFYRMNPEGMRGFYPHRGSWDLARDGTNVAAAFLHIASERPEIKERILAYLKVIVPEIVDIRRYNQGIAKPFPDEPIESIMFEQVLDGFESAVGLHPYHMSDGTLRALGILVAVNQLANDGQPIRLVGIEEPETALHPASAGALLDALREAASHTQVLVTTHSADLLDLYDPEEDRLLLATMSGGTSRIAPIDEASRTIIRKHLDTAGGLLRMDQLAPDLERQKRSSKSADENGAA